MNVLMLNGSPHKNGCTVFALNEVAEALRADGIDSEIIQVGHIDIRGCLGCRKCASLGKCAIDDVVNEVAPKFEAADGLVIGSPVYYASPNGTLLSFLDRLFYSSRFPKTMKVGASVVSCRRGGNTATFDALNKYFGISSMPIVTSTYWNMIHGNSPEDAAKDLEGIETMYNLGHNMAFLIKSIAAGQESFGLPDIKKANITSFADGK